MFYYLGNERLQLFFTSPNICATFLTMSVLLCIGIFLFLLDRKKKIWNFVGWGAVFPCILIQFILLASTYSRGGYVACCFALLMTCILSPKKLNFLFLGLWIIVLLSTVDGVSRVQSIGHIGDGSIRNRLLIWEGGLGIIAQYWACGLGEIPEIGSLYTAFYQPLWLDEKYLSLINDYLTIAAQYGIFVLFFVLTFLFFLLQQSIGLYRKERNPIVLYASAAVLGYMVAALFSTFYTSPDLTWLLGVAAGLILVFWLRAVFYKKIRWTPYLFFPAPILAAAICISIIGYGIWINARLPFAWENGVTSKESGSVKTLTVKPCNGNNNFHVLLPIPQLEKAVRPALRPLSQAGFTATAFEVQSGFEDLDCAEKVIRELSATSDNEKIILYGIGGEQAIQALALAARLEPQTIAATVVIDLPFDWPFEELSPQRNIANCQSPLFLLFHAENFANAQLLFKATSACLFQLPVSEDPKITSNELAGLYLQDLLTQKFNSEK